VSSLLAALTFFVGGEHGWVGGLIHHSTARAEPAYAADHPSFLGLGDPHEVMYYVSAAVGLLGILAAARLHGPRGALGLGLGTRTEAAVSRADLVLPRLGPIAVWAQHKWYVDELYDFLFVRPLWVLSNILHLLDKLLVDGLVNFLGLLPRLIGWAVRPTQSGVLHGYAVGMAGGLGVLLLIVLLVAR
jgi:NADH:ubiquinone oxidoreductase subunit 5 (subunit L)/multisubunit Na+/H+ antiporter MnhA subunit